MRAAIDHEHPNVRAAALDAMAGWPEGFDPVTDASARVLRETLPLVRLAWVRYLAHSDQGLPALASLARDADREVAHAAVGALMAHPQRDPARVLALGTDLVSKRDEVGLLELALACERTGATPKLLIDLATACEKGFGDDERSQQSWAAVFHSLLLRLHHFVAPHGLAFPHVIQAGWLGNGRGGPRRRALVRRAARLGGADLAQTMVYASIAAEGADRAEYLEGAIQALDPQTLVDGTHSLSEFGLELKLMLWDRMLGRATRWDPEKTAHWLRPSAPVELRQSVTDAVASTFANTGDEGAGELLVGRLADPDAGIALTAFASLCSAADPQPYSEALYAAVDRPRRSGSVGELVGAVAARRRAEALP